MVMIIGGIKERNFLEHRGRSQRSYWAAGRQGNLEYVVFHPQIKRSCACYFT